MFGAGPAIAALVSTYHKRSGKSIKPFKKTEPKKIPLSSEKEKIIKIVEQQFQLDNLKESNRVCPECNRKFSIINVYDIIIDSCKFCRSLWFDFGELKTLIELEKDIPFDGLKEKLSDYSCPVCNTKMYKKVFMKNSNLIVDLCKDHGLYLENGELKRVFELSEKK